MCNCNSCNNCSCNNCCVAQIVFQKLSAIGGVGVAGATFVLYQNGAIIATATSDAQGYVLFPAVPKGCYQLQEVSAPDGFIVDPALYPVSVGRNCAVCIAGIPMQNFQFINANTAASTLTVTKTSATTGALLQGAVFALAGGAIGFQQQVTDFNGQAVFTTLPLGVYTLSEVSAPIGYEVNPATHTVVVAANGIMTNDGVPTNVISIPNTPEVIPTV